MTLYIKNMVCSRCVMMVKQEMAELKIKVSSIGLGEVILEKKIPENKRNQLKKRLENLGFEILDNQKQKLIEKIKTLFILQVQNEDIKQHFSINAFLSATMLKDYGYISRLFSEVEGITIEQYFILQKIEKTKELLIYGEMNTSEISLRLGYSSVAHLSAQFKKITGLTPTAFKKLGGQRKFLDDVNSNINVPGTRRKSRFHYEK